MPLRSAGAISGYAGLTINGTTINGNANTGIGMDASAGSLTITAGVSVGSSQTWYNNSANLLTLGGNVNNGGNTLTVGGGGRTLFTNSLGGNGGLTVSGGSVVMQGGSGYIGTTTINGGTLQVGNFGATGSLSPSSAIVNNSVLAFARTDTVTQGVDFSSAGISGAGTLVQLGSGKLILTASNAYTGPTIVRAGTLQLTPQGTAPIPTAFGIGVKFSDASGRGAGPYPVTGPAGAAQIASWNNVIGANGTQAC